MERAVRVLRSPVFVIAAVTVLAGALRFSGLSEPGSLVFDETYYAKDACIYLGEEPETCGLEQQTEQSWVHPPLGKWLIAGGEALFGPTIEGPGKSPFGWRFSSAVAGTITVALVAILALVLTGSALWAGVAGLLLATENLHFVQSRMSMLDIFIGLFVVAGFLCMALDRRWIERREPVPPEETEADLHADEPPWWQTPAPQSLGPGAMAASELAPPPPGETAPRRVDSPVLRWWRLGAGAMLGAAAAVKWAGLTALFAAALLAYFWEVSRRRRAGRAHPFREALFQESFGILIAFVVVPLLVYLSTYAVWLSQHDWSFRELLRHHGAALDFHWNLEAYKENGELTHPYQSPAWTWMLMARPVSYFYEGGEGTAAEILGMGNPAIFWGSLVAIPWLVVRWIRRREWPVGLVAVAFLVQYGLWLPVNRPIFLFYMIPIVPFMVLALTLALKAMSEVRTRTGAQPFAAAAGLVVGVSVTLFVFFHPVLVGDTIAQSAWSARMWFNGGGPGPLEWFNWV